MENVANEFINPPYFSKIRWKFIEEKKKKKDSRYDYLYNPTYIVEKNGVKKEFKSLKAVHREFGIKPDTVEKIIMGEPIKIFKSNAHRYEGLKIYYKKG
jgi:hypothetical protein